MVPKGIEPYLTFPNEDNELEEIVSDVITHDGGSSVKKSGSGDNSTSSSDPLYYYLLYLK
jgi:hypothetical protein